MNQISTFLNDQLALDIQGADKATAIKELTELIRQQEMLQDPDAFHQKILDREKESSTALGSGVAIPHVRLPDLKDIVLAVGFSKVGIDFDAPDGMPVHLVFMIAATRDHALYLKIVSRIAWLVRNEQLRNSIFSANSSEDVMAILKQY
jgi:fructose PTS system EIIBC or EIIC component